MIVQDRFFFFFFCGGGGGVVYGFSFCLLWRLPMMLSCVGREAAPRS